jgi:hypothetical protein
MTNNGFTIFVCRLRELQDKDVSILDTIDDVKALKRLNSRIHTLAERSCNGRYSFKDDTRVELYIHRAMKKVIDIFSAYGYFTVTRQSDPRLWGMFEAVHKLTGEVFRINW